MKTLTLASAFALLFTALCGWVLNVVKLIGMLDGEVTAMFLARVVGMFAAPLGAILGFF
jgi:hypothetical protein